MKPINKIEKNQLKQISIKFNRNEQKIIKQRSEPKQTKK
jgi:hypothetical protein